MSLFMNFKNSLGLQSFLRALPPFFSPLALTSIGRQRDNPHEKQKRSLRIKVHEETLSGKKPTGVGGSKSLSLSLIPSRLLLRGLEEECAKEKREREKGETKGSIKNKLVGKQQHKTRKVCAGGTNTRAQKIASFSLPPDACVPLRRARLMSLIFWFFPRLYIRTHVG